MNWSNWATVADLSTALGTLVLAVATFSAVRSSNLTARVAQQSMLIGLRPVLMTARREDPQQKVNFGDSKWLHVPDGQGMAEVGDATDTEPADAAVYLALAVRNIGSGIAVLGGWHFYPEWHRDLEHAPLDEFQPQSRDMYIPASDIGFWQGAFRDPADPRYGLARKVVEGHQPWTLELLYGDHDGGQRCITRFAMLPPATADPGSTSDVRWFAAQNRHWNLDRPDPR